MGWCRWVIARHLRTSGSTCVPYWNALLGATPIITGPASRSSTTSRLAGRTLKLWARRWEARHFACPNTRASGNTRVASKASWTQSNKGGPRARAVLLHNSGSSTQKSALPGSVLVRILICLPRFFISGTRVTWKESLWPRPAKYSNKRARIDWEQLLYFQLRPSRSWPPSSQVVGPRKHRKARLLAGPSWARSSC